MDFVTPAFILDVGLLAMLLVVAFAIVRLRSLFAIVMLQGVFSLLCAAWFVSLDAVDVAFTEAAVGAGISTVLMLGAMLLTEREAKPVPMRLKIMPMVIVTIVALSMFYAIPDMPGFGDGTAQVNSYMGQYYVEATAREMFIPNVVSTTLASYRGYDTMGETTVIFLAGLGIYLLLGFNGRAGMWRAKPAGEDIAGKITPADNSEGGAS